MSIEQIAGLSVALLIMGIGLLGCILPGLPSTPLVLVGAVAHKLYFGDLSAGWIVISLLGGFTALSLILDYLASVYGAKRFGATWLGITGALLGGLIGGLFFNLPGLLLGPFFGALMFEIAGGRRLKDSSRAGVGATLGFLAGALGKLACCLGMMALFTGNVLYRSLG